MTDRNEVSLDAALAALAPDAAFPPTPDLAHGVGRRLAAGSVGQRRWRWGRPAVLAAALTLLLAATVVALAWALPGLRILPVASVPPAPTLGSGLALGEAIARQEQPFAVAMLGAADAAYVSRDAGVTTLVFAPREALPEIDDGIGLLVQRVEGRLDQSMVMKLVDEVGARVVPVSVDGADGFWVTGPPHLVRYVDADGRERSEMTRLAGDTLVWQRGDALYRIESALSLDATLRLAQSVEE